jgi:hypothetical protein
VGIEMLQRAAATDTEVGASRRDPVGRRLAYFEQLPLVVLLSALRALIGDVLARQSSVNENGFAVADDTLAFMRERNDRAVFGRGG